MAAVVPRTLAHYPFCVESTLKKFLPAIFVAVLAIVATAYYALPQRSAAPLIAINRMSAGLQEHAVKVGAHTVHYLSAGSGMPVILLHGIFAEKDHWVDFARALKGPYQLLVPDLPGFGRSGRLDNQSYSYAAQVERLLAWMDTMGIEKAHLAGNSMGGTLAALFAQRYPQRVLSLAFIGAPHGIRTPQPSAMDGHIDSGASSILIPTTERAFEDMLDMLFEKRPFLPYPIAQRALAGALRDAPSNERIWKEQLADRYLLDERIGALTLPMLVLWGAQDRLFDASGSTVLQQRLRHATVQVLPSVGHLIMMEVPSASAKVYGDFLARHNGQ